MERILLAYSGGLDASIAIAWLAGQFDAQVVTVTLDVGQARDLGRVRDRALEAGAVRAHVLDVRQEFATGYILPALQAGAIAHHRDPLAIALTRPLIASKMIEIAELEQAGAVAIASSGDEPSRIEVALRTLAAGVRILVPARTWNMDERARIAYARARRITVPVGAEVYRIDENLWGRTISGGPLGDPWIEPPESVFTLTKSAGEDDDLPAFVEVEFERGTPTSINGIPMPFAELIVSLETIAGAHGVGRIDAVDRPANGRVVREVFEAPAAVVLSIAHRALTALVTPHDVARRADRMAATCADLIYDGLWFSPERTALGAAIAEIQEWVTGTVRLRLRAGDCRVVGRRSPFVQADPAAQGSDPTEVEPVNAPTSS